MMPEEATGGVSPAISKPSAAVYQSCTVSFRSFYAVETKHVHLGKAQAQSGGPLYLISERSAALLHPRRCSGELNGSPSLCLKPSFCRWQETTSRCRLGRQAGCSTTGKRKKTTPPTDHQGGGATSSITESVIASIHPYPGNPFAAAQSSHHPRRDYNPCMSLTNPANWFQLLD